MAENDLKILKNAIYDHSSIINELTLLLVNESVIFFETIVDPLTLNKWTSHLSLFHHQTKFRFGTVSTCPSWLSGILIIRLPFILFIIWEFLTIFHQKILFLTPFQRGYFHRKTHFQIIFDKTIFVILWLGFVTFGIMIDNLWLMTS